MTNFIEEFTKVLQKFGRDVAGLQNEWATIHPRLEELRAEVEQERDRLGKAQALTQTELLAGQIAVTRAKERQQEIVTATLARLAEAEEKNKRATTALLQAQAKESKADSKAAELEGRLKAADTAKQHYETQLAKLKSAIG